VPVRKLRSVNTNKEYKELKRKYRLLEQQNIDQNITIMLQKELMDVMGYCIDEAELKEQERSFNLFVKVAIVSFILACTIVFIFRDLLF